MRALTLQRAVELMADRGAVRTTTTPKRPSRASWIFDERRADMRAWEEAPLLDEIAVNAGYRRHAGQPGTDGGGVRRLEA